jgi:polysaccharide chain length determinant protein (PEP-CTERM system associated)
MATDRTSREPDVRTIGDVMGIVRRRKRAILLPAVAIFALAAALAVFLPKKYQSTTTILIEEQEVPREYVSANITTFADQRLQTINQRIMSTTRLLELIGRFDLYADLKDKEPVDEIVAKMRKDIQFQTISADVIDPRTGRPAQATIAFSITYEGRNPETVQRVASELASLYLQENLNTREKQSLETSKFMEEEMTIVQASLAEVDAKIAAYKEKNISSLPELSQVNLQALDQVERDLTRMEDQLRTLRERESYLQEQLASIPPDLALQEKESLKELRVSLVELKTKYSDEHPDVINTRAAIKELEGRLRKSPGGIGGTKPDNPAYITLASQLAGAQSEIASVKRQIGDMRQKRESFRKRIEASPRVEERYRAFLVQRNNLQGKFDELTRKAMDARVAHGLEEEQLGERFSIIDAARLPEKPSSPNVPAILLIGLILGMGAGVGTAAVQESTDQTVHSSEHLARAVPFPLLVSIPEIVTEEDVAQRKGKVRYALVGGALLLAAGVLAFSLFVMDLDVLLAKVMRKFFS